MWLRHCNHYSWHINTSKVKEMVCVEKEMRKTCLCFNFNSSFLLPTKSFNFMNSFLFSTKCSFLTVRNKGIVHSLKILIFFFHILRLIWWFVMTGSRSGLVNLYKDMEACAGYNDIQVMWEMIHSNVNETKCKKRPFFWRFYNKIRV